MSQEDLSASPLSSISIDLQGTKTDPALLKAYIHKLTRAKTVAELHTRIVKALNKLTRLEAFRSCNAVVLPGHDLNTAVVQFDFKDLRWWELSLGFSTSNEGGRSIISGIIKNLRGRADQTKASLEYKHNTGTWGYEFTHVDKLFNPKHFQASYSFRKSTEEVDQNIVQDSYGGSLAFETFDGAHKVVVGRSVRTNLIAAEYASLELLRQELPTTAKNSAAYTFTHDGRDSSEWPTKGLYVTLTNEVALGRDTQFHKIEGRFAQFLPVLPELPIQISGHFGLFNSWFETKTHINDRFRGRYLKGFRSVGTRFPPADPDHHGKFMVGGDDLGTLSQLSLEARLLTYNLTSLRQVNLTPFIYANLIVIDPLLTKSASHFLAQTRGSVGFGLGWSTKFGRIEFSYASRVFSRAGDVPAEFQILFAL